MNVSGCQSMKGDSFSMFFVQEVAENCQMIFDRIAQNNMDRDAFAKSTLYQDMLTMPMIRLCEAVKLYREDFEKLYPGYDWKSVGAMRDKMAHPYGGFDYSFVWDASQEDLPELKRICERILEQNS